MLCTVDIIWVQCMTCLVIGGLQWLGWVIGILFYLLLQGGRTADAIVQEALNTARMVANDRLSGKKTSSGGGKSGGGSGGSGSSGGGGGGGNKKDVIELTDSNFEELVINSEDYWLVEFYAPW